MADWWTSNVPRTVKAQRKFAKKRDFCACCGVDCGPRSESTFRCLLTFCSFACVNRHNSNPYCSNTGSVSCA